MTAPQPTRCSAPACSAPAATRRRRTGSRQRSSTGRPWRTAGRCRTLQQATFHDPAKPLLVGAEAPVGWGEKLVAKGPEADAQGKPVLDAAGAAHEEDAGLPGMKAEEQAE